MDAARGLPEHVGLCPDPYHTHEFFVPLTAAEVAAHQIRCPEPDCDRDLIVYTPVPIRYDKVMIH
jgi:hypothetical protein